MGAMVLYYKKMAISKYHVVQENESGSPASGLLKFMKFDIQVIINKVMSYIQKKNNIMSVLEMKVPSPGESITEVEIAEWMVEDGDYVEKDQTIAEVDSDKATLRTCLLNKQV
jgi:hypothetical protein